MEFDSITVRGEGVSELLTEFSGPAKGMNKTRYATEGFSVIAWDRYDVWRTSGDLMAAVIMNLTDSRTCEVVIMAGGGAEQLLGLDWNFLSFAGSKVSDMEQGSEATAIKETIESLEKTCDDLTLDIARE